jgi:hypothetical protein
MGSKKKGIEHPVEPEKVKEALDWSGGFPVEIVLPPKWPSPE